MHESTTPPPSGHTLQLFSHFCVKLLLFFLTTKDIFVVLPGAKDILEAFFPLEGKHS